MHQFTHPPPAPPIHAYFLRSWFLSILVLLVISGRCNSASARGQSAAVTPIL